jgi:DnaJ-class molecular chaperone
MICPDCQGSGVNIIDESHTDICDFCDGYGYVALVEKPNDTKSNSR